MNKKDYYALINTRKNCLYCVNANVKIDKNNSNAAAYCYEIGEVFINKELIFDCSMFEEDE